MGLDILGLVGHFFGANGSRVAAMTSNQALKKADSQARFQDAVRRGNVFTGANALGTPVTTQAGLSATTPALTCYNPIDSGVDMVLWLWTIGVNAAPAAAAQFCLARNVPTLAGVPTAPTSPTDANIFNNNLGATNSPKCNCYRVATLSAAPVAFCYLGGTTGAAAISGWTGTFLIDGIFTIRPGVAVSVQSSSAAAIYCSATWEEVPQGAV